MRSGDFPQIVAPTMYASGGDVPSWLQPTRRDTGPADYAYSPPPPQRDDPLNGELNRGAMTAKEYAAKHPKPRDPQLKAKGGKIHPAIHHHIAHALIKLAEGGTVDEHAHLAALSPYSDDPEPTEKQKQHGSYKKGHMRLHGLDISIENPAGSKRRPEWPPLKSHYGYLRGTHSSDDSHVDVFVKPGTKLSHGGPVHIVDQIKADGMHDEPKILMGWPNKESAKQGYLESYEPGWQGMGALSETSPEKFKDWVMNGTKSAPYAKRAFTKTEDGKYMCHGGES